MTIPNFITLLRFFVVPAIIYALLMNLWGVACILFLFASISDGLDGFIARHFNQGSELGTYLDPIADKILLSSVFVVLTYINCLPLWLVIVVVVRDVLIFLAIIFSEMIENPMRMKPIIVSKLTTFSQIILISFILIDRFFMLHFNYFSTFLSLIVVVLTSVSGLVYIFIWMRHLKKVSS